MNYPKRTSVSQRSPLLLVILIGVIVFAAGSLLRQYSAYHLKQSTASSVADTTVYSTAAPSFSANIPCVSATAGGAASLGSCSMPIPMEAKEPVDRFEVDLRTGKFILRQTDLSIPSANVYLTRTYTPQDWLTPTRDHAFGMHSNHPFDIAPLGKTYPYTEMELSLEDGSWLYMPRVSSGTSFSDAVFQHTETDSAFYNAVMKWAGDGWEIKSKDGTTLRFPDSNGAHTLAEGAPFGMINSVGQKIDMVRDPLRHLTQIRSPGDHWISFQYDSFWHIVRAEDDAHNWSRYDYSVSGMLQRVENSQGHKRLYGYDGELLTSVTDENGQTLLRNWYDGGWIVRQEYADGATWRYEYEYNNSSKSLFAINVTVTSPDGLKRVIPTGNAVSILLKRAQ